MPDHADITIGPHRLTIRKPHAIRMQVLRDPDGGDTDAVLVAVGAPAELLASPYHAIPITDPPSAERLRAMIGVRILRRDTGELVAPLRTPTVYNASKTTNPSSSCDHS